MTMLYRCSSHSYHYTFSVSEASFTSRIQPCVDSRFFQLCQLSISLFVLVTISAVSIF